MQRYFGGYLLHSSASMVIVTVGILCFQGNVYVKCATPDVAVAAVKTMQGRWFAGALNFPVYSSIEC